MSILQVGDVIVDYTENTKYRVIAIQNDVIVLCEMDIDKLSLIDYNLNIALELIAQNQLEVQRPTFRIFDESMLSDETREKFLKKKSAMQDLAKTYGPTFLELASKKPKPVVKEIMKKYDIKMTAFWATCRKYLQGGMQDIALVDQKAFGNSKGKEYEYSNKPGKRHEYLDDAGVVVTEEIRKYFQEALLDYKSGRQKTIHAAFDKMNLLHFTKTDIIDGTPTVNLLPAAQRPTYNQFYNYVRKNLTEQEKDLIKTSAREQRNDKRLITSDSMFGVNGPGDMVEIDACEADVSLVSMLDPNQSIGRPIVYFMIDVYSRAILAASISFDNNSIVGLTSLFLNLADSKQEYCNRYGMNYENLAVWPSNIIPKRIRVDRGSEFKGKEFERICNELNIERIVVPAATGSMKGVVEQSFHQMHSKQNVHLENYGLIEKRHDSKHHTESTLNIYQYTQMIISFIITHNQECDTNYPITKDMIEQGLQPVPALLWEYGIKKYGQPRSITNMQQYLFNLMIPVKAKLSKRGICYKELWYLPSAADDSKLSREMFNAQSKRIPFEVRIDPRDVGHVYYIRDGKLIQAPLNERLNGNIDYQNLTFKQYEDYRKAKHSLLTAGKVKNEELSAFNYAVNNAIVQDAKKSSPSIKKNLRPAREAEKQLVSKTNRIAPKLDLPVIESAQEIPLIEEHIQVEQTEPKKVFESWDDVLDEDWD